MYTESEYRAKLRALAALEAWYRKREAILDYPATGLSTLTRELLEACAEFFGRTK